MPVQPWVEILNWKDLPRFVEIHLEETERFRRLYHSNDPMLKAFVVDLLEGLTGTNTEPAVRVESPPGWGKTSCFYFLAADEKVCSRFYPTVLHAGLFVGGDGVDRKATFSACFESVYGYLKDCAPDPKFAGDILNNADLCNHAKLNAYLQYIRENKSKLSKRLVLIIDDVDTVRDERYVLGAVVEVFKILQQAPVVKWLAVRNITYANYSQSVKNDIDTLFPIVYQFPNVSLSDIAALRIREVSREGAINPFSVRLCHIIQQLHNGDHRKGLATLKELLLAAPPGGLRANTGEEFVQKYIERISIKVLLKKGPLPNLFAARKNVNTVLPLPMEVLQLSGYRRQIDRGFVDLVRESIASKSGPRQGGPLPKELIQVDERSIREAADYLDDLQVIDFRKANGTICLTEKGRIAQRYVEQAHYIDTCRELLGDTDVKDETFWRLAQAGSPYGAILRDRLLGGEPS